MGIVLGSRGFEKSAREVERGDGVGVLQFTVVSDNTMHSQVYARWREILGIEELLGELKVEVDELDELLRREAAARQQRAERKMNMLLGFIAAMSLPALVTGFYGMNIIELVGGDQAKLSFYDLSFWIPGAVAIFLFFSLLSWFFWTLRPDND